MTFEMLYSKIHRATVSDANLNYVGSITIDEELMKASNLRVGQKVDVVNINNGERFQTYVIKGEFGKLNGKFNNLSSTDSVDSLINNVDVKNHDSGILVIDEVTHFSTLDY
jgi:L-aspartate-alpha-decarboxylase